MPAILGGSIQLKMASLNLNGMGDALKRALLCEQMRVKGVVVMFVQKTMNQTRGQSGRVRSFSAL